MINPHLDLPAKLYAVPGFEISVYFQNIVRVINPANYAFDVKCAKGRCDALRWRWTPQDGDVGSHKLGISVWSDEGELAYGETEVVVSPRNAGAGQTVNYLAIGASCAVAAGHGEALFARFQSENDPHFNMLGSHAPGYGPVTPGGPAVEAFGGWTWQTFFVKTKTEQLSNDGLHPARPYDVPSPFLFLKNGAFEFDFKAYLEKYCNGVRPDVVTFELGVNSVFRCQTDEEFDAIVRSEVTPCMEKMFQHIRQEVPDVIFGIDLIPTGSWSQDAFGNNYQCDYTRRRWLRNAELLRAYYTKEQERLGFSVIPCYVNNDGDANYPKVLEPRFAGSRELVERASNAVHPTPEGFVQWADSEYFWIKSLLK